MGVSSLHHVAIRVQDLEASRRFYEDVLGFAFMEIPVSGAFIAGWKGAPTEGKLLATQAGNTFVILEPPLEGTGDDDRFSERRIGVDHLAFGVEAREDLERLEGSLRKANVDTAGIEFDPVLQKEYVAFRDPDNVQWEFYMAV
jgi:catechol 2,3-dioxygenase-like lactoylglutathione lyase family enzyme